jgi:hypothetical protein
MDAKEHPTATVVEPHKVQRIIFLTRSHFSRKRGIMDADRCSEREPQAVFEVAAAQVASVPKVFHRQSIEIAGRIGPFRM